MKWVCVVTLAITLFLISSIIAVAGLPDPGTGRSIIYAQNIDPVVTSTVDLVFTTGEVGGEVATYPAGSVPPKGMALIAYPSFPPEVPGGWVGSVEVQATTPMGVVGSVLWDNSVTNVRTAGMYVGVDAPATAVYLPYLGARFPDKQNSRVTVQNTAAEAANITIHWLDRDGAENLSKLLTDSIPAKTEKTYDIGIIDPFATTIGLGSAYIESNRPIAAVASMFYGPNDYNAADMYPATSAGDTTLWIPSVFRVYNPSCGNPYDARCYLSYNITTIQNLGDIPAEVTVEFWKYDGTLTHSLNDTIQPKAARAYNMSVKALLPDDMWAGIVGALGDQWRGAMKVYSTNGQALTGISSLFAPRYGVNDCLMYPAIRESEGTENALVFPIAFRKKFADGSWNQWSTTLVQNLTSTDGDLTVEFYNSYEGRTVATWPVHLPANGLAALNLQYPLALDQAKLDEIGNMFAGAIYVTPPEGSGIKIVGNTQVYWIGGGRAAGYPGIPVP